MTRRWDAPVGAPGWLGPLGAALALAGLSCTYDIPSLPGTGGAGGDGASPPDCELEGCQSPSCPEERPHCSPTLGCVECQTDANCEGKNADVCDRGVCVRCAIIGGEDTCQASGQQGVSCSFGVCDQVCSAAGCDGGNCVGGRCVECTSNEQCNDAQVCDTLRGLCVQCADDGDCAAKDASKPRCSTQFECVACLRSEDCKAQPAECIGGECQPRCCNDADCAGQGDQRFCDTETQQCTGCSTNEQCHPQVCESLGGACVACGPLTPCVEPLQCNGGSCE